jgi:hypothetical protein
MRPISATKLPNTVTVYNLFKEDEGNTLYFKTIVERVRVSMFKNHVSMNTMGPTARFSVSVLIDPNTSLGYVYDQTTNERIDKRYMEAAYWRALPTADDKAKYWTLNPLDWMFALVGEQSSIGPYYNGDIREAVFRDNNRVKVINEVTPVIDKDGAIHHWKVYFD